MKNKRSAFEMSITTIVILVIAMIMLILGIMLVRKIMCGGMNIAEETLQGAKSQISKLFGEQTGEIRCLGSTSGANVIIVPGRKNVIGCMYTPEDKQTTYNFQVKSARFKASGSPPQSEGTDVTNTNWFIRKTDKKTVDYGYSDIGGVEIWPPKGTPAGTLIVDVEITKEGESGWKHQETLTYEVRSLGFLRETAC
jgi:hypothetical protein